TTPGLTLLVYLLLLRPPPTSTLFPYTTLFRSAVDQRQPEGDQKQPRRVHQAVHGNDGDEFRHTRLLRPRAPRRAPRAARRKAAAFRPARVRPVFAPRRLRAHRSREALGDPVFGADAVGRVHALRTKHHDIGGPHAAGLGAP